MAGTKLLVALFLCAVSTPVWAQGNSGGNASSESERNGQGSNGENGSDKTPPSSLGSGSANEKGGNTAPDPQPAIGSNDGQVQEEALSAVQSGHAVPLASIAATLDRANTGEIIDAMLVKAGEFLLYRVKVLSPDGVVTTEFFYAATGRPVTQR